VFDLIVFGLNVLKSLRMMREDEHTVSHNFLFSVVLRDGEDMNRLQLLRLIAYFLILGASYFA